MSLLGDLIGGREKRIAPAAFFLIGVSLFIFKFVLDCTVAMVAFGREWSILNYLIPNETYALPALPTSERWFYLTMLAVALPFVWIGIIVTLRRLADAKLPRWLVVFFFVPAVNLLFFAALSVIRSARPRTPATIELPDPPFAARADSTAKLDYAQEERSAISLWFDQAMPHSDGASHLLAIFLPAPFAVGATILAALVMRDYGWGLFVGMPFVIGMVSAILYGYREPRTMAQCLGAGVLACCAAGGLLIAVALEGIGCLIMLMPLALPISLMGAALGCVIQDRPSRYPGEPNTLWAISLTLPLMIIAEGAASQAPRVFPVTTTIEVAAPPEKVWPNVIEFGEITAQQDLIFRAGVSCPLCARIEGTGVGAIRYCEFTTGTFIEPIEVWDAPRLLKFSVTKNPPPMREWSPFNIHPPHLENFLVSHGGQFKLIELPGGRTRIEGTTWYEHRMRPAAYWRWWSDFLIHRIHRRVLEHVKQLSERGTA